MEEQTLTPVLNPQKILVVALGLAIAVALVVLLIYQLRMADPYVRSVLAIDGRLDRGNAIFQMNCSGCHGSQANGKVGPSLRGIAERRSQISLIHQITSGKTPPMPEFQVSPQEMADLLSYLKTL